MYTTIPGAAHKHAHAHTRARTRAHAPVRSCILRWGTQPRRVAFFFSFAANPGGSNSTNGTLVRHSGNATAIRAAAAAVGTLGLVVNSANFVSITLIGELSDSYGPPPPPPNILPLISHRAITVLWCVGVSSRALRESKPHNDARLERNWHWIAVATKSQPLRIV